MYTKYAGEKAPPFTKVFRQMHKIVDPNHSCHLHWFTQMVAFSSPHTYLWVILYLVTKKQYPSSGYKHSFTSFLPYIFPTCQTSSVSFEVPEWPPCRHVPSVDTDVPTCPLALWNNEFLFEPLTWEAWWMSFELLSAFASTSPSSDNRFCALFVPISRAM